MSIIVSVLCVAVTALALTLVLPEVSRITLFAEFSLLAVALPGAMLFSLNYGQTQRRRVLDPCASPLWLSERFWVAVSAVRDRAFRLHGWIAAAAIAACTVPATERALAPALVATRAENLAPWLAAALALIAGAVVAATNEALMRQLRTAFRSGVTDYAATLMARFHGATGLLTLLIAALFFQGDTDFLTRLAVATIATPTLSWAATLGFCAVMLAWPLRAAHHGAFWLFVDTDARTIVDDENSVAAGATWAGGPVVVVCSPPDETGGEHRLACALAGETDALRVESRADIDAWMRSQPEPAHWTANPRRLMFVTPALLDTVRERCVRKGDSVALLTADGALARRWLDDEGLDRNEVSVFAGDDAAEFAAHVDYVYERWSDAQSTPSAQLAAAAKRSPGPLLFAQLFERLASFALYAHLLATVADTTLQSGYVAETIARIPLLYVAGLLIAGIWLAVGPDRTDGRVVISRECALHGSVTGLLFGAIGIAALLARWSPLFDAGIVIAVIGIALYRYATTNLLVVAYDDPQDAPRRGLGFAAWHVIGAVGAALGSVIGFSLPIDSAVPIAEAAGIALGVSALYLALATKREPLHDLPSLLNFVRPDYLLAGRNLILAIGIGLLWLSGWEMFIAHMLLLLLLLVAGSGARSGNGFLAHDDPDYDPRRDAHYQPAMLLLLLTHFAYWVCAAHVDYGIDYLLQDATAQTSTPNSFWTAWQPGILLAALVLLTALRGQVLVNHTVSVLGVGVGLTVLAALVTTLLDFAVQWSSAIAIALVTTGQLLVAASGFTLLHNLFHAVQRRYAIALWLATPIITAYIAPAVQSGRPTFGAAAFLTLILIIWLSIAFTLTAARNSEISEGDDAADARPTGSRNPEPR